jgi:hypothetical protein
MTKESGSGGIKSWMRDRTEDAAVMAAGVAYKELGFTANELSIFRGLAKAVFDTNIIAGNKEFESFNKRLVVAGGCLQPSL